MNGHEIYHGLIERTCGLFDLATSCTVGMLAGGEVFFGGGLQNGLISNDTSGHVCKAGRKHDNTGGEEN